MNVILPFRCLRAVGGLGRFIFAVYVASALNFAEVFSELIKAADERSAAAADGMVFCYMGPPAIFFARFTICVALLVATIGIFTRKFPRGVMTISGLTGALFVYTFSWFDSYRVFRELEDSDIRFLNSIEFRQTAYLLDGSPLDIFVALSTFVGLVLVLDRLLTKPHVCETELLKKDVDNQSDFFIADPASVPLASWLHDEAPSALGR